jgi:hypothetical protein
MEQLRAKFEASKKHVADDDGENASNKRQRPLLPMLPAVTAAAANGGMPLLDEVLAKLEAMCVMPLKADWNHILVVRAYGCSYAIMTAVKILVSKRPKMCHLDTIEFDLDGNIAATVGEIAVTPVVAVFRCVNDENIEPLAKALRANALRIKCCIILHTPVAKARLLTSLPGAVVCDVDTCDMRTKSCVRAAIKMCSSRGGPVPVESDFAAFDGNPCAAIKAVHEWCTTGSCPFSPPDETGCAIDKIEMSLSASSSFVYSDHTKVSTTNADEYAAHLMRYVISDNIDEYARIAESISASACMPPDAHVCLVQGTLTTGGIRFREAPKQRKINYYVRLKQQIAKRGVPPCSLERPWMLSSPNDAIRADGFALLGHERQHEDRHFVNALVYEFTDALDDKYSCEEALARLCAVAMANSPSRMSAVVTRKFASRSAPAFLPHPTYSPSAIGAWVGPRSELVWRLAWSQAAKLRCDTNHEWYRVVARAVACANTEVKTRGARLVFTGGKGIITPAQAATLAAWRAAD